MKRNVVVINWAGLNYGDNELFNLIYNRYLKDSFNSIYLLADSDQYICKSNSIKYISRAQGIRKNWIKILVCMLKSKKIICGGGDIIRGEIGTTLLLLLAIILKKEVGIFGTGVIEINSTKKIIKIFKEKIQGYIFKKSKVISVRDMESYNRVKKYTDNVEKSIDICFLYENIKKNVIHEEENIVSVSLIPPSKSYNNEWGDKLYKELAQYLDFLIENYNIKPIFLIGTKDISLKNNDCNICGDDVIATLVINYMKHFNKVDVIENIPTYEQASDIISKSKFMLSFRLHYTITSIINRTPVIAVNYAKKVEELLNNLDMQEYKIEIDELRVENLKKITSDILMKKKNKSMNINEKMKKIDPDIMELDNKIKKFLKC